MSKKQKLVTLDVAVKILNEEHQNDPAETGRTVISKKTLYNAICSKKLKRYGPFHMAQVDVEELLKIYGPKQAS